MSEAKLTFKIHPVVTHFIVAHPRYLWSLFCNLSLRFGGGDLEFFESDVGDNGMRCAYIYIFSFSSLVSNKINMKKEIFWIKLMSR